ncbi:MAG: hypothetical protein SOX70_02865 [Peptoniphilaceae bacterium]|nr:hypothetical protein [Peptoniphilaceae bacterium]
MDLSLPVNIYHTIAKIHEYKGRRELYVENYPDVLEKMTDVAKIQSTKSSLCEYGSIFTGIKRIGIKPVQNLSVFCLRGNCCLTPQQRKYTDWQFECN